MGSVKIQFLLEGEELTSSPHIQKWMGRYQYFQRKYNLSTIEKLNVDNDFCISFNIDQVHLTIDWDKVIYPTEKLKLQILEITYYSALATHLSEIGEKINRCKYEQKEELLEFGNESQRLISGIRKSVLFLPLNFVIDEAYLAVSHTLKREVQSLMALSNKTSNQDKFDALKYAITHLTDDINDLSQKLRITL